MQRGCGVLLVFKGLLVNHGLDGLSSDLACDLEGNSK